MVREPVGLLLEKGGPGSGIGIPLPGSAEEGRPVFAEPVIVHPVRLGVAGTVQLLMGEEPPLDKFLQIQQPGVAGKGGRGHVGGVATPWRHQREDLPGVLPGLGQKVNELPGTTA